MTKEFTKEKGKIQDVWAHTLRSGRRDCGSRRRFPCGAGPACLLVPRGRVDPTDIVVGTPIDNIDAAGIRVTEDQNRRAGQIEVEHRGRNRETAQPRRRLGDDGGAEFGRGVALLIGRLEHLIGHHFRRGLVAVPVMMALQPLLVAAQTLFESLGRLVEGGVGLLCAAVGLKDDAGGEMQAAIGAIARALGRDRDMAADAAVEIFRGGLLETLRDMRAQRFADIDVLA